jgi:hypothetical protein
MPLRGESIGTAYVRVLADGSGLPKSVRDEFDNAGESFDDAGNVTAKRYKEAFSKEMESHTGRSLDDALAKALARDDFVKEFFEGEGWRKFETNIRARFGDAGQDAANQLRDRFIHSGSLDGIEDEIERIVSRINVNVDKSIAASEQEAARVRKLGEDFRAVWLDVEDDSDRAGNALTRFFGRLRGGSNDVNRTTTIFGRLARTTDHLADGIGRAFGKGSRNDFLNFVGSFTANTAKLISVPFKLADNLGQFTKGFRDALKAGEGFFSAISSGFSNMARDAEGGSTALAGAFSNLFISLPALAVALLGIVSILSIVASLISGIVAALIAMASTVSFALVAVLATLGALLPPIALGIGTIVLGITTLDNKSKKALKEGLKPFIKGLKDLGETAREGFLETFNADLGDVADKMRILHPLVGAIGEAFGEIGNQIVDSLDSPTLRRFINQMTRFAPNALESLTNIAGNTLKAILAIFTDSEPMARRFLNWLEDITGEFADFITANPKQVTDFLKDAAGSARSLGHFLGAAAKVLGDLLFSDSGRKAGNQIFNDMADALNEFDDFLDKHPDALGEFFQNGVDVARSIGNIAVSLGHIFAALDSPEGHKNLELILDLVANINALAGPLASISNFSLDSSGFNTLSTVLPMLDDFARTVAGIGNITIPAPNWHALVDWIPGVLHQVGHFFQQLGHLFDGPGGGQVLAIQPPTIHWASALNAVAGFFQDVIRLGTAPQRQIVQAMQGAANGVIRALGSIPGHLGHLGGPAGDFAVAAAGWALGILHEIQTVPGSILAFFHGLGDRIADAIGSIGLHFDFPSPPSWLSKAAGPGGILLDRLTASGGIFDSAQVRVIAEAGREAVVPLDRPLDQVDPSVRWLAALARGQSMNSLHSTLGTGGKTINNEWNITMPSADPIAAANELLNRMAGSVI